MRDLIRRLLLESDSVSYATDYAPAIYVPQNGTSSGEVSDLHPERQARRMPSIGQSDPFRGQVPTEYVTIASRKSIADWSGYHDISDLQFIGGGAMGYAFLMPNGNVLKLTSDIREAVASEVIRLSNEKLVHVLNIYKVAKVRNTIVWNPRLLKSYPMHIIINEYIPNELSKEEDDVIMYIFSAYVNWAKHILADNYARMNIRLSIPHTGHSLIRDFERSWIQRLPEVKRKRHPRHKKYGDPGYNHLIHGDAAIHRRRIRRQQFNPNAPNTPTYLSPDEDTKWLMRVHENMELVGVIWEDIKKGLIELGRLGIGYVDIHSGNVRKRDDNSYVLIDIGRSFTEKKPEIPVIENIELSYV